MVPKDNFTAAEVTVNRRTNVQANTVVVRASVCCGQVQTVIRRNQNPKTIVLVPRGTFQDSSWALERGEAAPPVLFTYHLAEEGRGISFG